MQDALRYRQFLLTRWPVRNLGLRFTSAAAGCASVGIAAALFLLRHSVTSLFLLCTALLVLGTIVLLHGHFLRLFRRRFLLASRSLETREQEFRCVFDSALDAILILDNEMVCQEANPAALSLLNASRGQLVGQSFAAFGMDRGELYKAWKQPLGAKQGHGQLNLLRTDGARVGAEFTASFNMLPGRHLLVLHDATQRLQAEEVKSQSLFVTRAALQEAGALRQATLALTESLHLSPALDALLMTLRSLIPFETAQILLLETPTRFFVAREISRDPGSAPHCAEVIDSAEFPALQQALAQREGLLIHDTQLARGWQDLTPAGNARSWLGVPLYAGKQAIGLLSLMHSLPMRFTAEHRRLAACMAIPATVAIENARLRERAEICSAELEKRLAEIRRMEEAMRLREDGLRSGELN